MRRIITLAVAGALALAPLAPAAAAQAAAMRPAAALTCTEEADYSVTENGRIAITVIENTCDDWIQARFVCEASQPGPFYYYYGAWVNDSTGQVSTAAAPGDNCPVEGGQPTEPYVAGFLYSKTGRNDVNCWTPGKPVSGICSS